MNEQVGDRNRSEEREKPRPRKGVHSQEKGGRETESGGKQKPGVREGKMEGRTGTVAP